MSKFKLADNVREFLNKSSSIVADFHHDRFSQNNYAVCADCEIESPIEQILYFALETIRELNYIGDGDLREFKGIEKPFGLRISPQAQFGKFRVDFLVSYDDHKDSRKVIVECDSQEFHDRTEKERRYEKMRDRFLQSQGYTVFRFTGSEICKEPFRVASEIIGFLTNQTPESLRDFLISVGIE